jgi:hypothetical protein
MVPLARAALQTTKRQNDKDPPSFRVFFPIPTIAIKKREKKGQVTKACGMLNVLYILFTIFPLRSYSTGIHDKEYGSLSSMQYTQATQGIARVLYVPLLVRYFSVESIPVGSSVIHASDGHYSLFFILTGRVSRLYPASTSAAVEPNAIVGNQH